MEWKITSDRPVYVQLVDQLEMSIITGMYGPGDRIPPVRELAAEAAVNPNTMQRALTAIESEGLIITQRTSGRSVTVDEEAIRKVKNSVVAGIARDYLIKMAAYGYDSAAAIKLLEELKIDV